jgi:hypothetical protein
VQDWNRLQMILNTAGISFGSWFICGVAMKSILNFTDFSFGYDSAIWNNGGDCAMLHDAQGNFVNQKCY